MTYAASAVGRLTHMPILRDRWRRRGLILVLVALCGLLTLFPERQRAAMSLTPESPPSLGLSAGVGQLGALNSVFGNQSQVEVALKVANSAYVRDKVITGLKLEQKLGMSRIAAQRWLHRKVEVRSMRGGIIQIEMQSDDGDLARQIVGAYGEAVSGQMAAISRNQATFKRDVLVGLVADASERLEKAQADYDAFRTQTRYSQPIAAISAIGERIPVLEQMIKSREVELNAQRQFATDDNISVRQIVAQLDALRAQLAEAKSISPTQENSVGQVIGQSTRGERLRRDLLFAQLLYETYRRVAQGTTADEIVSPLNVRVLEPPYIDPVRQYNLGPAILGVLILTLGLAMEFYILRPPVGDRRAA